MLSYNKKLVNIISYYTSKFLNDGGNKSISYKYIGFKSRAETHRIISNMFNIRHCILDIKIDFV